MNKSQNAKQTNSKNRKQGIVQWLKRVVLFPWNLCKKIWNWLKSIDIVGMINLTLLVAIIVLFSSLIIDVIGCRKCSKNNATGPRIEATTKQNNRGVVQRKNTVTLPLRNDNRNGVKQKIKTVGVKNIQVVNESYIPEKNAKKQRFSGDVIVDVNPSAPILQNGVYINGNLFIQNMRKYTLPCGANINGNLFIRNVDKLSFCGEFIVNGNVYVTGQSSFGAIPDNARIVGNIIL
jgi:hypothetical protein